MATFNPLKYEIRIEPDVSAFTFTGKVAIEVDIKEAASKIQLNAVDLEIQKAELLQKEKAPLVPTVTLKPEKEELLLELEAEIEGTYTIRLHFSGHITDNLLGFYRSHYYEGEEKKYIFVTQFEERHARKAFPCFDHPAYKSRFAIEYLIPESLGAISNTPIKEEIKQENGLKLVRFEETPPLCVYTIFFGIGDFKYLIDEKVKPIVRIAGPPGRVEYGDHALKIGRDCLMEMENFTSVDYPLEKCDHISVQDFAFGAMENMGAVTYRENLLLVYPKKTTKSDIIRITTIIIHETAHMWFGNLVSPLDWKYLWLNESFASWFTYYICDLLYPEWDVFDDFYLDELLPGLSRDAYLETHPIELKGDYDFNIDGSTAPIIYNKGASFLQMLVDYIGIERFKEGCQRFLQAHQYKSVDTNAYWEAFNEILEEDIQGFADSWVFQEGFPLVTMTRHNGNIELKQERFTNLPNTTKTQWKIPIIYGIFSQEGPEPKILKTMLEGERLSLEIDATATIKLNMGWKGFFRVDYPEEEWQKLGRLAKEKTLGKSDRFQLVNDYFALVIRGNYIMEDFLAYLETYFAEEQEYLVLIEILGDLDFLLSFFPALKIQVQALGEKLITLNLQRLGFEPKEDETVHDASLRRTLLWFGYKLEVSSVVEWGTKMCESYLQNTAIHEELLQVVMNIAAYTGKKPIASFFEEVLHPDTNQTEKIQVLRALSKVESKEELEEIMTFSLEKLPKNNCWLIFPALGSNTEALQHLWHWFLENTSALLTKVPLSYFNRILIAVVKSAASQGIEEIAGVLDEIGAKYEELSEVIVMAKEKHQILLNLRKKN